jgi:hypothetical protein
VIPSLSYEETQENFPAQISRSKSFREFLLPPIRRFKPLTVSNFTAITNQSSSSSLLCPANQAATEEARLKHTSEIFTTQDRNRKDSVIRRKPVPPSRPSTSATNLLSLFGTSALNLTYSGTLPTFDPRDPLFDSSMHTRAKAALKKRYQSKFIIDFTPPTGASKSEYDFMWAEASELENRVLSDVVWVRERFAYAGKDEPTDEEIIWWFNAGAFGDEGDVDIVK